MTKNRKILLALNSIKEYEALAKNLSSYVTQFASSGAEALEKFHAFSPALVIIDLLLFQMHGLEVIKRLQATGKHFGVILVTDQPSIQAYDASMKLNIDYFLMRPFEPKQLEEICNQFFANNLKPDPFQTVEQHEEGGHCYIPKIRKADSYIKFWGSRGSSAVSGSDYIRYGGNSSCLEIRAGEDLVIIDAGTGIRPLGDHLIDTRTRKIHLFLSHTHWDHITGFPFFAPIFDPEVHLSIWAPVGFETDTRELFVKMLAYAFFPVRLEDIRAKIEFHDLRDQQQVKIGDLTIATHYAYHPGATLCFKVFDGKTTIGYVTDNEVLQGYHGHPNAIDRSHDLLKPYLSQIEFLTGVDLLIHEAQYTPFEYQERVGWGHSSVSNAAILVKHTKAKEWLVTHHDPKHTDAQLAKKLQLHRDILEDCHIDCRVAMAYDSLILPY